MCVIALLAITSATRAEFISGSINFSSAPGGGIVFQDSAGNVTTNLAAATGIRSWSLAEVEEGSGSFNAVTNGSAVTFSQPWVFNPSTATFPLWTIAGPENFTFNLTSTTVAFQNSFCLAIIGTGTLTGNGFNDTPAKWMFTTQGVAVDHRFNWSACTHAVPDGSMTLALLSGSLLGLYGLRSKSGTRACIDA